MFINGNKQEVNSEPETSVVMNGSLSIHHQTVTRQHHKLEVESREIILNYYLVISIKPIEPTILEDTPCGKIVLMVLFSQSEIVTL